MVNNDILINIPGLSLMMAQLVFFWKESTILCVSVMAVAVYNSFMEMMMMTCVIYFCKTNVTLCLFFYVYVHGQWKAFLLYFCVCILLFV